MMSKSFFELSNPQNSIWVTEQFYNHTNMNNICGVFNFNSQIDIKTLKESIQMLVRQNDALRLRIVLKDSKPMQYVADYEPFDIPMALLTNEKELDTLKQTMATDIIDVLDSPLFHFTMFQFPNGVGGYVVTIHHLAADAMTLGLVGNKTYEIYQKLINKETPEENTTFSYLTYLNTEKEYVTSEKYKKDETYWNELYTTVPETATIPATIASNKEEFHAERKVFEISKEKTEEIKQYCKEYKISLYQFFMAIFSLYIGRVSNLDDFAIGTPILNRTNFKEKNTLGMFISNLPFRVTIEQEKTFTEYASSIAVQLTTMLRHQRYPYQYLLENLRKKDASLPNLYNITLSYQITKASASGSGCTTDWIPADTIADDMQIHFYDLDYNGSINIAYDYRTSKYEKEEIEKIQRRIIHMINQILLNRNIIMKSVKVVTPEEKYQILHDFNNTHMDYPKEKTIIELFEEQVEKTPSNVALVFGEQTLTYQELNEKANQLAHYLIHQGIKNNDVVALVLNRSLEMIIAILGILKSGAAYLPIDPTYPKNRIEYILEDSHVSIVLTKPNLLDTTKESKNYMDITTLDVSHLDTGNPNIISKPEDLSYFIYTSGSTGTPKGVMLKQSSLTNLTYYCNHYVEYLKNPIYRAVVSITTVSFDIFLFETLISLQRGLKLVIANEEEQTSPSLLNKLIEKEKIEIIQSTPSRMKLLLNHLELIPSLKELNYITLAGEQLPFELVQSLKDITGATIYNGYGPSETTVFSTLTDVTNHSQITIGKPLANTQIYILDKNQNLCPIGVPGELYIAGDGVGHGYANKPDMTAKSFVQNPFIPGSIMYKTGDLGYFKANGEIVCLGRCDNQVKIRGLRIELDEIEKQLLQVSNVTNCVVAKKVAKNSHEFLCAYFTKNGPVSISNIRTLLQQKLPSYMVPQYFVELDTLPYTPNGKIDKKALPMPELKVDTHIVEPRNEMDTFIVDLLKEQLPVYEISMDASFYDLGGDSLTAIQLSTAISSKLQIQVSVKDILEHLTIMDLSDFVSKQVSSKETIVIEKAPKTEYYPTSSAQKRIYSASLAAGKDSTLYNITGGILFDALPDVQKLENCFKTLIQRHESLRTCFDIIDGDIVQIIKDTVDFSLQLEEVTHSNLEMVYADFIQGYNLDIAPLFRVKLVKLKNEKILLLLDMHHIISDGTSLFIFAEELCDLYNGSKLSDKLLDYKDFSVWENAQLTSDALNESKRFWINQFQDDIPVLHMPTSNVRPAMQNFQGANIYTTIDSNLTKEINQLAKKVNVTPYMLLLSIYYILLYKYSGNNDIVIGSPIAARETNQVSNMIGMFVNTLPLRNKIDATLSFRDFLSSIKQHCMEAFTHQSYPYNELIKDLNMKIDTSRNPLFDVLFTYQSHGLPTIALKDCHTQFYIPDTAIAKFDLSLEIIPREERLDLRFEYATQLFHEDFIKQFSSHYINILKTVLQNTDINIADIDMLSQKEKNQIIYDFNHSDLPIEENKNLVDLFEEIVKQYSNKTAVVHNSSSITYSELDQKSTELAQLLIHHNVQPSDVVGVCLNKSIELLISIWAILKCGATYMPMYIAYPKDRLNYMLKNSATKLVITNATMDTVLDDTVPRLVLNNYKEIDSTSIASQDLPGNIANSNLAYIIYTSGSTGKPKGVKISHKNLLNFINSFNQYFNNIGYKDIFLSSTNISFDVSIWELFLSILNGSTLVLYNEEVITDIVNYCNTIINNHITTLYIPPNILNEVYSILENSTEVCINKMLVGVSSIKKSTLNKYYQLNPNMCIINGYGPTETTICATALTYLPDFENDDYVSIGRPLYNNKIYILDEEKHLQPIGVPGELYVSGYGVGQGYIYNDVETAKRFLPDSFNVSSTMYKTGDLAKWNADGTITFIGRMDNQVKISGYRVELSEINHVLSQYPYITKSFTTLKDIGNKPCIITYFTSDKTILTNDLLTYLQEKLPFYMIPKFFMQIETLPLTPNGKVDTRQLPLPELQTSNTYVAPQNETQEKLAIIWRNLFNLEKIGIHDNFFELGGDSLTAIKLQIEALKMDLNINYSDIFSFPTIQGLSENHSAHTLYHIDTSYDYQAIDRLLEGNCVENIQPHKNTVKSKTSNLLLLGATGFLGAHILDSFLSNTEGSVYCLVRKKGLINPEDRLKKVLNFYFDDKYNSYFGNRIVVVYGDITNEHLGLSDEDYRSLGSQIGNVINSAALVKHFGDFTAFQSINVIGTKNIIQFCKDFDKKLYHISTTSVSGIATPGNEITDDSQRKLFDETNFYVEQNLNNAYVYTKFEAEKVIFEEIQNGLKACVLRIGNIANRYSDGKFQINPSENAFVNSVKSILKLGIIQNDLLVHALEFTPVDSCSDAIIHILQDNPKFNVLHLFNTNLLKFTDMLSILHILGYNLEAVNHSTFSKTIEHYLHDDELKNEISGIITYLNDDKLLSVVSNVLPIADFSTKYLRSIQFEWPIIDENYMKKYLDYFKNIGYIN